MTYVLFVVGLVLLIVGAEALVRGASRLAENMGVPALVVGLTIVAFGTSSPELAVSIQSALEGQGGADIALGNVVGSNIFNVLFILGLSAAITPLAVAHKLVRIDVPLMILLSFALFALSLNGELGRIEGVLLVGGIIAYTAFAIRFGRDDPGAEAGHTGPSHTGSTATNVVLIVIGLAMLVLGSRWLVNGAVTIAESFGVSQLVIGLTIVSAGTSLPEVATSVLASVRGQRDIAIGNVVGSNIFNILAVLGLSTLVSPTGINISPAALAFDIPVMIAVACVCLPIFFTGYRIGRLEALVFLGYYVAYVAYLILATGAHDALSAFSSVLAVAISVSVLVIMLAVIRQLRPGRSKPD